MTSKLFIEICFADTYSVIYESQWERYFIFKALRKLLSPVHNLKSELMMLIMLNCMQLKGKLRHCLEKDIN